MGRKSFVFSVKNILGFCDWLQRDWEMGVEEDQLQMNADRMVWPGWGRKWADCLGLRGAVGLGALRAGPRTTWLCCRFHLGWTKLGSFRIFRTGKFAGRSERPRGFRFRSMIDRSWDLLVVANLSPCRLTGRRRPNASRPWGHAEQALGAPRFARLPYCTLSRIARSRDPAR